MATRFRPPSEQYIKCYEDVLRILDDRNIPIVMREWLTELAIKFNSKSENEKQREIKEHYTDYQREPDAPYTGDRLWAIAFLIKKDKFDKIRQIFTRQEILSFLPKLNLTENDLDYIMRKI